MFYVIVNPAAKSGLGLRIWKKVKAELDELSVDYRYYFTSQKHSAQTIARCICNKDHGSISVILLGGDGTVNEFLQGVADIGESNFERLRLGYIPAGSASDLARGLGIKGDPVARLRRILAAGDGSLSYLSGCEGAKEKRIDLGVLKYHEARDPELNGRKRYFLVSAGMGFDAAVCAEAMGQKTKGKFNRLGFGSLSYGYICIKRLLDAPGSNISLFLDRKLVRVARDCLFVAVMNHKYQGGGVMFCPEAKNDDGVLDLCFTDGISRFKVLRTFPSAYHGGHVGVGGICFERAQQLRIASDEWLWVHTDGEVKTKAKVIALRCLPGKLKMLL